MCQNHVSGPKQLTYRVIYQEPKNEEQMWLFPRDAQRDYNKQVVFVSQLYPRDAQRAGSKRAMK
jgi:hypothetical protein